QISDIVRVTTIVDVYAALVEKRAYRLQFTHAKAFSMMEEMGGKLDQQLLQAFRPVRTNMDTATTGDINIPADIAATLVDPVAYADDRIHDSYRWLRANNPLGIAQPEKFDPFWVVTKHAHIQAISRQNDLFHNADRPTTLTNRALEERVRKITGSPNLVRSLVQMDAPDHPKYRALTQGWFMPNNLGKFEGRVREIARATILGVPEADEPRMLKLTQELFGPQDPDTARVRDALSAEQVSVMLQAIIADFSAYYMIVATAGHDTTSSSTAGAIWALARDPVEFAKVKANPDLIPGLVDEAIRWMTPVKHFMRSATADTELGGRKIAKGDWLMLCYASGNRDEEVFEEPDRFRSDRKPNRHVAFGYGA
ncbi:Cytochrome P450-terp, partial [Aduncisulcus paluster]